jgi:hypothetical protein
MQHRIFSRLLAIPLAGVLTWLVLFGCSDQAPESERSTPIVVITDMEPDDRVALHLLVALFPDRGYRIYVEASADSLIELVESFDKTVFEETFTDSFEALQE